MYCGQCGTKIQEHESQCGNCGKPISQPIKAKTATINYKKWGIIAVIAVLIIFFIPKMFGGEANMSSPYKTVTGFIKAVKKQDIEKMYNFFKPDNEMTKSELTFFKEQYKEMMKDSPVKVKDYKILDVEIDGKEATVEYMVEVQYGDEVERTEESIDLIQVGSKWYIDDSFYNF
ncbi:hypothetical protein [Paenibacillus sp. GCM10028914]|uniref:hypothetical protein n=1 Tax=Paenibacillus sp. GCM10028914 TaxID=3273416 RepID=UPI00361FCAC2